MSSLDNILSRPKFVESVGYIYPVIIKDYDEFMENANVISYTYDHFDLDELSNVFEQPKENIKLLDLITIVSRQTGTFEQTFNNLKTVFSIVLRSDVNFAVRENGVVFYNDNSYIDRSNYDEIRKIIMGQNLIFSPKIYKSAIVQEWANKVIAARAESAVDIRLEDMLSTISIVTGKHYWDLEKYSYYQIKTEFARIGKDKAYHTNVAYQCAGAEKVSIEHYAENAGIDMNPYDDIFVDSKKNSKLDKAMGG
jgi:hypothetical protein